MQVYRNPLGILESWKGGHTRSLRCLCTSRASAWWGGSSSSLDFFNMDIPGAQMTSIFEGQPPKTRPFPIKTRVIWVPGIYIYIYIFWFDDIYYISKGVKFHPPGLFLVTFLGGSNFTPLKDSDIHVDTENKGLETMAIWVRFQGCTHWPPEVGILWYSKKQKPHMQWEISCARNL